MDARTGFTNSAEDVGYKKRLLCEELKRGIHSDSIFFYEAAQIISSFVHHGEPRRSGKPYYESHILNVVNAPFLRPHLGLVFSDKEKALAEVHDVIEKKYKDLHDAWTIDDFRYLGFDEDFIDSLIAISKKPGEPYFHYMMRVCTDESAMKVKLADNDHNNEDDPSPERARLYAVTIPYLHARLEGSIPEDYDIALFAVERKIYDPEIFMLHGSNYATIVPRPSNDRHL